MNDLYYEQLTAGVLGAFLFLTFFFIILGIFCYLFFAIGLMTMANRLNVPHGWLAFIPIGSLWVFGEVLKEKVPEPFHRNTGWWLILIFVIQYILSFIPVIGTIIVIAYGVLHIWLLHQLYTMFSEKAVVLTIITIVSLGILSSFFVFAIRNNPIRENFSFS